MAGWVKLHRTIKEHWIWKDANRLKWWIDILLSVNHEPKKVLISKQLIECGRGQSLTSLAAWAAQWGVSIKVVRTFFDTLEMDGMIVRETGNRWARLTVCNYDTYQETGHRKGTEKAPKRHSEGTERAANKNDKEYKEGEEFIDDALRAKKEKFKEFLEWMAKDCPRVLKMKEPLSFEQWDKITTRDGKIGVIFKNMHNYVPLLEKNQSAYLTYCNWKKREHDKQP